MDDTFWSLSFPIFMQQLVSGLALGCVYGLIALGYSFLFNATGIINLAQGSFVMVGAYIYGVECTNRLKLPFYASLPVLIVSMAIFGMLCERLFYRPFKRAHLRTLLVSLVALGMLIGNLALIIWSPYPQGTRGIYGQEIIVISHITILKQSIFILIMTVLLLSLQRWLFNRTMAGKIMRAVALDKDTASLMGIDTDFTISCIFAYSSILGGIAGLLVAPIFSIDPTLQMIGFKGFGACVIGSFTNLTGAMIGGLILGIVETMSAAYVSSLYKDAIAYAVIIAFLIFRPEGLFGQKRETGGL
ncbi:MAG: branched-chain amino acid ABC transporter permease [Planctomycetes bacterium]|nr:branched-chain amino acid ABC transporter permease [Planctomycetota bacterium]